MRKNIIIAAGTAVIIGVTIGYHLVDNNRHRHDHNDIRHKETKSGIHTMQEDTLMTHSNHENMDHTSMSVQSERDFLQMMIPHHEEAVTAAKEVLARGGSTPEIRNLAENIITAQEQEISDMKTWHQTWYNTPYQADGTYIPMMRDLSQLSGADLDYIFLKDMIPHHEGAIAMAKSVELYSTHPEIDTLATAIQSTQKAEIVEMENLITTLKIDTPDLQ